MQSAEFDSKQLEAISSVILNKQNWIKKCSIAIKKQYAVCNKLVFYSIHSLV